MFSAWFTSILVRKTSPDYEVVPFVLVPYALFSIFKIYLAKKNLVQDGILTFSVILDIFMVTGLIWVFHVQYEQLPGFYLKVPTFIYYFFFIALRELRYSVKYVLLAGGLAITGWSGLLLYALFHPESIITHSFVGYTDSHHILIGAEIEKMIGLLIVTLILAVSVRRKRSLLFKSVADSNARKSMTKFFSQEVAEAINQNEKFLKPGFGEVRSAGILMIDIRGFTKMTNDWPPEDTLKLLSQYQSVVVPIILKNNGCIDKYMGDGIFAHFGAAVNTETYAADLLKSMIEIHHGVEVWNSVRSQLGQKEIEIGIASSVGEVIFGTTGENNRLEFTTIGSAVNIASKLEKHTKELKVCTLSTRETLEMAREQGLEEQLPIQGFKNCHVEGMKDPIDLISFDR